MIRKMILGVTFNSLFKVQTCGIEVENKCPNDNRAKVTLNYVIL
jgi:hypothetical protein